jgi:hypothetical protein
LRALSARKNLFSPSRVKGGNFGKQRALTGLKKKLPKVVDEVLDVPQTRRVLSSPAFISHSLRSTNTHAGRTYYPHTVAAAPLRLSTQQTKRFVQSLKFSLISSASACLLY